MPCVARLGAPRTPETHGSQQAVPTRMKRAAPGPDRRGARGIIGAPLWEPGEYAALPCLLGRPHVHPSPFLFQPKPGDPPHFPRSRELSRKPVMRWEPSGGLGDKAAVR